MKNSVRIAYIWVVLLLYIISSLIFLSYFQSELTYYKNKVVRIEQQQDRLFNFCLDNIVELQIEIAQITRAVKDYNKFYLDVLNEHVRRIQTLEQRNDQSN